MRNRQAARYARWSAIIALGLVMTVAGVYGYRSWQRTRVERNLPEAVPPTVQQQSAEFTFSKIEQDRTIFTITASRATEFTDGNKARLDDVKVTLFGRRGDRQDRLHSKACDYEQSAGRMRCGGQVHITLESTEDAKVWSGQKVIQIVTSDVVFDRSTATVQTAQRVSFRFPEGEGTGQGVTYHTNEGRLQLARDVQLTLRGRDGIHFAFVGTRLEFSSRERTLRLDGPIRASRGPQTLTASAVHVSLDSRFRARELHFDGNPALRATPSQVTLSAHLFHATLRPDGTLESFVAEEAVRGEFSSVTRGKPQLTRLNADRVMLDTWPGTSLSQRMEASGQVRLTQQQADDSQLLETNRLQVEFLKSSQVRAVHLARVETPGPANVTLAGIDGSTKLSAGRLQASFAPSGRMEQLTGLSGVTLERKTKGQPAEQFRSLSATARFDENGEWTELAQAGDVQFRAGNRTARAETARSIRQDQTLVLSGSLARPAQISDPLLVTTALEITIGEAARRLEANGQVRTSYRGAKSRIAAGESAAQPANISADHLAAAESSGEATYSGHARFWQGEAVVEADSIQLDREAKQLRAKGHVVALLPESRPNGGVRVLWRVQASSLNYDNQAGRVDLAGNVQVESPKLRLAGQRLELFLTSLENQRRIERAVVSGGVVVRTPIPGTDRRGTAERAEFFAREGRITLSGGQPTLFDAALGTTSGHQLTFFLAGGKIFVDSERGLPAITKLRVEK